MVGSRRKERAVAALLNTRLASSCFLKNEEKDFKLNCFEFFYHPKTLIQRLNKDVVCDQCSLFKVTHTVPFH